MPRYSSSESNFFDPRDYPWASEVCSLTHEIKKELETIIKERNGELIPYYSDAVSTNGAQWTTLGFKTWGIDIKDNLEKVSTIKQFLKNHPYVVSASVNILKPGAVLAPHQGDTNAIFRCHLGIDVQAGLPELGFEVEGEKRPWANGELLIFTDAKEHTAWNHSKDRRIIFLFDVIREEYREYQKNICINVRAFLLLQWLGNKMKWFLKAPKWMHRVAFVKFKILLWMAYPYQKRKGVIIKHS